MSRVGCKPVDINGIKCIYDESANMLTMESGTISSQHILPPFINCCIDNSVLTLSPIGDADPAILGLHRSLINNLALGMRAAFTRKLLLNGVGYKAKVEGRYLVLHLGYSHNIKYLVPQGMCVTCAKPTEILLESRDKHLLGLVIADLCSLRKYNPYKGKGVFPSDVVMRSKEAKKK